MLISFESCAWAAVRTSRLVRSYPSWSPYPIVMNFAMASIYQVLQFRPEHPTAPGRTRTSPSRGHEICYRPNADNSDGDGFAIVGSIYPMTHKAGIACSGVPTSLRCPAPGADIRPFRAGTWHQCYTRQPHDIFLFHDKHPPLPSRILSRPGVSRQRRKGASTCDGLEVAAKHAVYLRNVASSNAASP